MNLNQIIFPVHHMADESTFKEGQNEKLTSFVVNISTFQNQQPSIYKVLFLWLFICLCVIGPVFVVSFCSDI